MHLREAQAVLIAIVTLTIVLSFRELTNFNLAALGIAIFSSTVIILVSVISKRLAANAYDATVEHSLWEFERYGFKPGAHLKKPFPLGVVVPLIVTAITLGIVKWGTILTYETGGSTKGKRKISGYTFTEMTDWHTAVIGAAGISAVLALAFISYFIPSLRILAEGAAYYAFFNMIPFSKLDGAQIYFGSRVLWTALALVSAIFAFAAAVIIV